MSKHLVEHFLTPVVEIDDDSVGAAYDEARGYKVTPDGQPFVTCATMSTLTNTRIDNENSDVDTSTEPSLSTTTMTKIDSEASDVDYSGTAPLLSTLTKTTIDKESADAD